MAGSAALSKDAAIEASVARAKAFDSPRYPTSEEELRADAAQSYDRAYHPAGAVRQLAAVLAAPDRTEALRSVSLPTAVIHGADDVLIDVSCGKATAAAIPDATLLIIPGMGHRLPAALYDRAVETIVATTHRARGSLRSPYWPGRHSE